MTKPFTVYEQSTGRILRTGYCTEEAISLQANTGEIAISAASDWATDYIEAGLVVVKPAKPSNNHVFNYNSKQWEDPRTLDDIKATKWVSIKDNRNTAEYSGFTWDTSLFDSDTVSQSRIQGASQLATLALMNNQPFSIDWTLADNTVRTLTAQDMLAVGMALGEHINAQHAKARLKREAINAAVTVEEVNAITW